MADEIELKLAVAADRVGRLKRNPLIRTLATRRAVTSRLHSVYFDTPDLLLAKHGLSLRIRRIGDRRIQTLKQPIPDPSGLQASREFEVEIAADRPDLSLIDDPGLQAFFAEHQVAALLAPAFETEFERRAWPLEMFDSTIELAVDVGEIRSGDQRMPICEAELELKSGRRGRLFELALALHDSVPVSLETRTKAVRGYSLFAPVRPEPQRATPVRLVPEMSARDAFAEISRSCLAQLRANEACARRRDDPEGVHQLRVAVRRLRALVGAYRSHIDDAIHAYLADELRWLQLQLGPARDWDVFIDQGLARLRERLPNELALEALRREAEALRQSAYQTAIAALDAPRYTTLLLKLALWLDGATWARPASEPGLESPLYQPVAAFANAILRTRHKRLHKLGDKHAELGEAQLHKLRLLSKKLRYVAEFFRDLYPRKVARRYVDGLVDIQETLGSLNDAVVSRHLITAAERRLAEHAPALSGRAIGLVLGWQAARIDDDLRRFRSVWEDFADQRPFWG